MPTMASETFQCQHCEQDNFRTECCLLQHQNANKPCKKKTSCKQTDVEEVPSNVAQVMARTFGKITEAAEKEIIGLESIEEQMAIFDSISYENQAKEIVNYLNEKDKMKGIFEKMVSTYNSDDPSKLYDMFAEYYDKDAETMALMLDERNKNWLSRIPEITKSQATFIGVGAGHLFGEMGVINLLREAGYTVEAVN